MSETVKDRIISIIAEEAVMSPSDLRMDMTLDELGVDSLGLVESILKSKKPLIFQCLSMRTSREIRISISPPSARSSRALSAWWRRARDAPRCGDGRGGGGLRARAERAGDDAGDGRGGGEWREQLAFADVERLSIQIGGQVMIGTQARSLKRASWRSTTVSPSSR